MSAPKYPTPEEALDALTEANREKRLARETWLAASENARLCEREYQKRVAVVQTAEGRLSLAVQEAVANEPKPA